MNAHVSGCGFSTGTCKVGRVCTLPQRIHTTGVWAGPPVGLAACSHFTPRLGSKLTFSTGLAMPLLKTNTFLKRFLQLFLQDRQNVHVASVHKSICIYVSACVYLSVCICISVHLTANRHNVDLIIETSLWCIQRNCWPTMESMHASFTLGHHIISFITMRISFPTF